MTHKFKEVYLEGDRYISDDIVTQVKWLRQRSEEIYYGEPDQKLALDKLYQIIGMLSIENS